MTEKPRYYVTTAIAYPNGPPHIGHAYEAIATDAIARFMRLDGYDVLFLTGTDEHGIKMLQTAAKEKLTPQQLVERNVPLFKKMVKRFNCSNDDFIRTTEERHHRASIGIWQRMKAAGDIYLDKYSGWYSVRDEAYYDEDEIRLNEQGERVGPQGTPVEWVEEESYFFKLSAYQQKLLDLYERHPDFVLPKERLNEVISFVRGGLQDLSISRTTFDWGVKVPGNSKHVMYVWVDALTNYITAVGYPDVESAKFRRYWPADLHVIGKDIVRFHAVYWPAFLMSAGVEVPRRVFSHGFLFNRGEKMSKSVGNVIDPFALADAYGVDQVRYFFLREVPFGQDGNYSLEAIVNRINADLANDLGNLAQRSLSMIARQFGGVLPTPDTLSEADKAILMMADGMIARAREAMKTQQLHQVLRSVWEVVAEANRYFVAEAPWALGKTDRTRQGTVLYVTAEVIRQVAILAQPFMPSSAAKLLDLLRIPAGERQFDALGAARRLAAGAALPAPSPVFPRYVESGDIVAQEVARAAQTQKPERAPAPIASTVKQIFKLSQTSVGSEDDLIEKRVLPFFKLFGYGPDSYELKFPVRGYRPSRPGRKPEADCVFFSSSTHDLNSSLLVLEIKRDDPAFPEQQARFYSTNLFVPFYVAWNDLAFEIWQVQNYRPPTLLGRYRLDAIDRATLSQLKELLAPHRIVRFCQDNEIKRFDFDDRREEIEARYLDRLAADLRSFKVLDLPSIRNLDGHYVELRLEELTVIPLRAVQDKLTQGSHPEMIEPSSEGDRTFTVSELLGHSSGIAIVGDPGAGKTTLLRHLCLENAYADSPLVPIFVSIRELVSTGGTILEAALRQISRYGNTDNPEYLFESALTQGRILLCADGIGELDMDKPNDARAAIRRFNTDLSDILGRHAGNTIVVSARRESWSVCRPLLSQSLREFMVLPFTRTAARTFVSRWFADAPEDGERVIEALRARGWPSFATNPLLLTLTCACIPVQGELPKRVSELYARFVSFMLEGWDARRISDRPPIPNLDPGTILELLAELALAFHRQYRAAFTRAEVIAQLANHLHLLGLPVPSPRDIFLEITMQHGLLRSWSIDQHYAFPHLSFQAYFAAKAVRSHTDGYRVVLEHRHDSFWREAIMLYAELGDVTELARKFLAARDTFLASNLLLLADCWAASGKINDPQLSRIAIESLLTLIKGGNTFLVNRATGALARIDVPEAKNALADLIRDPDGHLRKSVATRFAVLAFGESILGEVVDELARVGYDENLLENFNFLPRRIAVEQLQALILRTDWPKEKDLGYDPSIRHIRRDAERLMAKVGEDIAIAPLRQLMSAPELSDFEKAGCVAALASIDDPLIPVVLREIVGGNFPMDCRIEAARNLAPDEPDARRFLLKLIVDKREDYYDRRDAASVLGQFNLTDDDLSAFRPLIFDADPEFIGGPSVAVSTVGKIGTSASRTLLLKAREFWQKSVHAEASRVRDAIAQALNLEEESADLRAILEKAINDRWINRELPHVASEYLRRTPEVANNLFVTALHSYDREVVYAGTLAWAVLRILPQISLTDDLLEAAVDLVKRVPEDHYSWAILAGVWQRRDLSPSQRELFRDSRAPYSNAIGQGEE